MNSSSQGRDLQHAHVASDADALAPHEPGLHQATAVYLFMKEPTIARKPKTMETSLATRRKVREPVIAPGRLLVAHDAGLDLAEAHRAQSR